MSSTELQQLADSFYQLSEKAKAAAKKANDEHWDLITELDASFRRVKRELELVAYVQKDLEKEGVTI